MEEEEEEFGVEFLDDFLSMEEGVLLDEELVPLDEPLKTHWNNSDHRQVDVV